MIAEGMVEGVPSDIDFTGVELNCPHCLVGKATCIPYKSSKPTFEVNAIREGAKVGDEVVSDSFGPVRPSSRNGNHFVVEFIDVAS